MRRNVGLQGLELFSDDGRVYDLPDKPNRGVSIALPEERCIELRKDAHSKERDSNASKHGCGPD
ncbi:hypothetical protein LRP30_33625 [Bradyrhizobium sp. C-145]|uniref:hypothetical protein n=1 Tax=Bradyrhizobium sp. C-145 TaxID=574727 RepID=UPI00201B69EF|nr:hypothetical protein [Bradyrhizobium sp. C-145]UQR61714.1 hypothetical protein LRP30_33625 [Bradyrhizobium sp. C-145]